MGDRARSTAAARPGSPYLRTVTLLRKKWPIVAGSAAGLLLAGLAVLWAAGVFKMKTADGILVVQVNEPNAEVFVDGDRMTVSWNDGGTKAEIHVKPGTRKVEVKKDGFGVDGTDLTFKDGDRVVFTARLLPEPRTTNAGQPPPDAKKPDVPSVAGAADGFTPLFNGKDLTGWKTHPSQPGNWRVEDGVLIGSGPAESYLYSERGDYKDFHLRAEARINDGGNSGLFFRTSFGPGRPANNPKLPLGYEAQINSIHSDSHKTGSLFAGSDGAVVTVDESPVPAGEWFTEEVIAEGNHLVVKVNGKTTADYTDAKRLFTSGHVALQQLNPQTVAEFRKIEIKELTQADDAAPTAPAADGFVSLFNGKDLTGWSVDSGAAERWKVEEGQIKGTGIGSAGRGWLLSEKEYENFVLTLEFQAAAEADGAVGIRARPGEMEGGLPHHLAIKLTGYTNPALPRIGAFYYWPNTWQQPSKQAEVAPKGEWNKLTVRVQGDELRISVNGQEVQNLSLAEFAKKPNVFPGVNRPSGRIGLQQHTGEIRFRNIEIKELPPAEAPAPTAPAADGFVPLFNGKDLTGWKTDPKQPGNWRVENGLLTGSGAISHLFTERGDFKDFDLHAEVRVNQDGNSGIYFHAPFGLANSDAYPGGYEVQICHRYNQPAFLTGSLVGLVKAPILGLAADEWFTMEIIAVGKEYTVKVNNKTTAYYVDEHGTASQGHFALQVWKPATTVVQFRNIEIKELPPAKTAPTPEQPAPAPPADPFQANSVWVNDGKAMTLTVLERKGETFHARFVIGNSLERMVTGTVKDGKVSWLAKDVRVIKGGPGADNQATITRDKDGDLLNFTYGDKGRTIGAFVLRLKKGQ